MPLRAQSACRYSPRLLPVIMGRLLASFVTPADRPARGPRAVNARSVEAASGTRLAKWVVGYSAVFLAQTAAREAV